MSAHLVWVRGLRAPWPQKWPDIESGCDVNGKMPGNVIATHPLKPDEVGLSLNLLAKIYPPPQAPKE